MNIKQLPLLINLEQSNTNSELCLELPKFNNANCKLQFTFNLILSGRKFQLNILVSSSVKVN